MKEVTVTSWCDGCAQAVAELDGKVEPAVVEVTVALGIGKPLGAARTLDLCDMHRKQLDDLAVLLDEYGASAGVPPAPRTGRKSDSARVWLCLWCPLDYAAESGLRAHLTKAHGFAAGTSAAFGTTCPLCGETASRLGMHTGPAHPEAGSNLTQVFRYARDAGDPLKVVAKRLRAGKGVAKPVAMRKG